jgi:hypothetical protein
MRQWNGRAATPAQFDITRIRAIGEWGNASRYVGSRWEEIGLDLLRAGVAGRSPLALLPICLDQPLQNVLASTGSKNPDVVLAFLSDGSIAIQPADLKWSLDVASYRQISAPILAGLLAQVPALCDAIRALLPPETAELAWLPIDGFFFAPRSIANERFLTSPENRRQEYPIEAKEVLFETVDPFSFFEPLPGWPTARELARMDGATRGLGYLDNADRYYHLGAGVAGAIARLRISIFDEGDEVELGDEVESFRGFVKTISPPSTGLIIDRLGAQMRQRQALQRELRELSRGGFGFKDFVAEVVRAGLAAEGVPESVVRRTWGDDYRSLLAAQDDEIREAGRRLREKGQTDAAALDELSHHRDGYARRLRSRAQALLRVRATEARTSAS